jgi:hypothetical protein
MLMQNFWTGFDRVISKFLSDKVLDKYSGRFLTLAVLYFAGHLLAWAVR